MENFGFGILFEIIDSRQSYGDDDGDTEKMSGDDDETLLQVTQIIDEWSMADSDANQKKNTIRPTNNK